MPENLPDATINLSIDSFHLAKLRDSPHKFSIIGHLINRNNSRKTSYLSLSGLKLTPIRAVITVRSHCGPHILSHDGGLSLIGDIFGYVIVESFYFLLFRFKRWGLLIERLAFENSYGRIDEM
eukprot:TRINITY_DN28318_c1_g1_i1.p1 TRINITY_DN28318_c1_g1~~TRINITY_DN28318_c1_g1_i1.p1  ORF type:complete len:123 (+),score=5.56 TRINITY_DN28318_c1_g1_i1:750-1118(+)